MANSLSIAKQLRLPLEFRRKSTANQIRKLFELFGSPILDACGELVGVTSVRHAHAHLRICDAVGYGFPDPHAARTVRAGSARVLAEPVCGAMKRSNQQRLILYRDK